MRNSEILAVIGSALAHRDAMGDAQVVALTDSMMRTHRPHLIKNHPRPKPEGENQNEKKGQTHE